MTQSTITNSEIIEQGNNHLYYAVAGKGIGVEVSKSSILEDNCDVLSFLATMRFLPFDTDDGRIEPPPCHFQIDYDREECSYQLIISEDNELNITYGNVMAIFYFSLLQPAKASD